MNQFIDGAILMAFCVAALFFLRFWRRTGDRLFIFFSIAFWIMAINRFFLSLMVAGNVTLDEHKTWLYFVRLIAFIVILVAIVDKNRSVRRTPTPPRPSKPPAASLER